MDTLLFVLLSYTKDTNEDSDFTVFIFIGLIIVAGSLALVSDINEERKKQKIGKMGKSYAFDAKGMKKAHDAICRVFSMVTVSCGGGKNVKREVNTFFKNNYEFYLAELLLNRIDAMVANGNFTKEDMEKAFCDMKDEFPDPKHREIIMNALCKMCDKSNNKNNTMGLIMQIGQQIGVMNGKVEDKDK